MNANFRYGRIIAAVIFFIGVCLMFSSVSFAADTATFAKDVAPILYKNCTTCHHPTRKINCSKSYAACCVQVVC